MSLIDNHKLMYHPKNVAEWLKNGDCSPVYVEIGLTNSCNHKCNFCALDFMENGKKYIDRKVMLKALDEMANYGVKSIMFAGEGESTLHKDIGLFTRTAKENGIDVSITTNGVPFTQKKMEECLPYLSWIRFSIDSGSPENYSQIHGTNKRDFEKVIGNIKKAAEFKQKNKLEVMIGTQFLMIPQNIGEAKKLAERLKDIGADNLQIKPYSHHPTSTNDLCVDALEYNSIEDSLREIGNKDFEILFRKATLERISEKKNYSECYGLSFMALIDSQGTVMPCNMFYQNLDFSYGNINNQSFKDIWESKKRKEVINKINKKGLEGCRGGCRLDVVNRYLTRLKIPSAHDNFI